VRCRPSLRLECRSRVGGQPQTVAVVTLSKRTLGRDGRKIFYGSTALNQSDVASLIPVASNPTRPPVTSSNGTLPRTSPAVGHDDDAIRKNLQEHPECSVKENLREIIFAADSGRNASTLNGAVWRLCAQTGNVSSVPRGDRLRRPRAPGALDERRRSGAAADATHGGAVPHRYGRWSSTSGQLRCRGMSCSSDGLPFIKVDHFVCATGQRHSKKQMRQRAAPTHFPPSVSVPRSTHSHSLPSV
jgi:hypothetical protein